MAQLSNRKIAVLATDGYEQSELESPVERLKKEGAIVHIVSLKGGEIKSMKNHQWSDPVTVDRIVREASSDDYDALLLPGGVINPDALRVDEDALTFVRGFFADKKPVAAICHGPQTLINAEVVKGKNMTSFKAISKDLQNAGAQWVDEEVVVDNGLVTSRSPKDLPAFNDKMVEEFAEGEH